MEIDIIFYIAIVLCALIFFIKLKEQYSTYQAALIDLSNNINEIHDERSNSFDSLSPSSEEIARNICLTEFKGKRELISIRGDRFLLNQPLSSLIPVPSTAAFKMVPALLTTIGILGTFTGISFGLYKLGSGWEDAAQLTNQAKELLTGMKTAFFTSIAGMGFSGIAMVALSWTQSKQNILYTECIKKLSPLVFEMLPSNILHQQSNNISSPESLNKNIENLIKVLVDQKSETQHSFNEISESLSTLCDQKSLDETSLADTFASAISDKLTKALPPVLMEPIRNQISDLPLKGITASVELLQEITKEIKSLATPITTKDLDAVLQLNVTEPLKEAFSDISSTSIKVQKSIDDISDALTSLSKQKTLDETLLAEGIASAMSDKLTQNLPPVLMEPIRNEISELHHAGVATSVNMLQEVLSEIKQLSTPITIAEISSALTNHVAQPLEQHAQNSNKQLTDINSSLIELSGQRDEEFMSLIAQMGDEIVKPITVELGTTNKVVSEFVTVSATLNDNVVKTVNEMAKATSSITNFETSTLVKLNEFASSMDTTLTTFATSSADSLNSITKKVGEVVEQGRVSMTEQTNKFSELVSQSDKIFTSQGQALEKIGSEAAGLMVNAKTQLIEGLGDIDNKVINMSNTIQGELERFRVDYQANLTSFFEEQNNSLELALGQQKNGLIEVVDKFKGVFEEEYQNRFDLIKDLTTQHENLLTSVAVIENLAKSVGLHEVSRMSEIEDTADAIGRQVGYLKKEFSNAAKEFNSVAGQLKPQMDSYFSRANDSVEQYFSNFDKVSAKIYGRLDRAAELLIISKNEEVEMSHKTTADEVEA
jgi:hypothetical protein